MTKQQPDGLSPIQPTSHPKKSESWRAFLRIASNFTRLFITVFFGLLLVPLVLAGWGNDAMALIALLGSTVGIAAMLRDVVTASMIRELGVAYHSDDNQQFVEVYNSSLILTFGIGLIGIVILGLIVVLLPILEIPAGLLMAARWLVVCKGLETVIHLIVGAPMNMYIVSERMGLSNFWMAAQRVTMIVSAAWIILVKGIDDPANGLKLYAIMSTSLFIIITMIAVVFIMVLDHRLVPRLRSASRSSMKAVLQMGGWNALAIMPLTLHNRCGAILMNLFFGIGGSLIYGFTSQLTSYVRMLATGVSYGLDAVSTRLSSTESDKAIQNMCYHMTRLNSCIALPAAGGLFILTEPILTYWVGSQMSDPETQLPLTATLIRIMCAGMVVRSLTDGWISILYGAGHVSKYAFLILGGSIANPIVAIILYFILPESIRFTFAVWAYTIVFVMAYLGLLPRLMGRLLHVNTYEILAPIIKPLIVTLVSMLILWYALSFFGASSMPMLFGMAFGYGILYTVLTSIFVLRQDERRLAVTLLKRVIPR